MRKLIPFLCIVMIATTLQAAPRAVKSFTPGRTGTVLLFVGSGCPCMDAHREIVKSLLKELDGSGVNFYCVFSNEDETRVLVDHFFKQIGWDMPFILDSSGRLADRFGATHTPQAFVLDGLQEVVYNGPIDDSSKNLGRVTKAYLNDALHDLTSGQSVRLPSVEPTGCWLVTKIGTKMTAGL